MRGRFWTPKTKHRVSNKKLVTNNPHVARLSLGCEFTKQKLRITQYPIDSSVQYIFSLRIYTNDSLKNLILRKKTEEEDKTLVEDTISAYRPVAPQNFRSTSEKCLGPTNSLAPVAAFSHRKDLSDESKRYLSEVERRDLEMEHVELTRVGDGVSQLKQVAVDMNERIQVQKAELDPIVGQLAGYREDIGEVNQRLKAAARKGKRWGSFGRNLLCMLLLVGQMIALGYLVDFVIKENRKS
ncbi:hypothetical protein Naga_100012g83 [Nannochloropsis gaditana]|uniref:t-SNARE coiled-coil homology domain-containing protein n=1 Tax=Nannochloropsis gaditana TaxID=72520 RepID=W7TDH2_9STRA|nr:hypothetical protein Naga_100012g83 [Nannochloropsis gaditana]